MRALLTASLVLGLAMTAMAQTVDLKVGGHILMPGSRHEILQETDSIRQQFWAAFDAYMASIFLHPPRPSFRSMAGAWPGHPGPRTRKDARGASVNETKLSLQAFLLLPAFARVPAGAFVFFFNLS